MLVLRAGGREVLTPWKDIMVGDLVKVGWLGTEGVGSVSCAEGADSSGATWAVHLSVQLPLLSTYQDIHTPTNSHISLSFTQMCR